MSTIAIVGDIFPQVALPPSAELAEIRALLRSADIAFGNLETQVQRAARPRKSGSICACRSCRDGLGYLHLG